MAVLKHYVGALISIHGRNAHGKLREPQGLARLRLFKTTLHFLM